VSNYYQNPGNASFRDFPPGPHSGVDTDPDAHVAPSSFDTRARTALTLGIASLVVGVLAGIPAVWYGRKALLHIEASDGALRGRGAAWTAIALGVVGTALTIGLWVYLHDHA